MERTRGANRFRLKVECAIEGDVWAPLRMIRAATKSSMSEDSGDTEGFLTRWSRRKREQGTERASTPAPGHETSESAVDVRDGDPFADFDFEALNFASDYRRFMAGSVPEHVQRRALRKLWTSTDVIAQTDELADFLEDFREEAMALPAEMVRSAYRIGRGFVDDEQEADEEDGQLSAPDNAGSSLEPADASVLEDKGDQLDRRKSETFVAAPADADKSSPATDKLHRETR